MKSLLQVSFHRFPQDAEVYKKWIIAIRRDEGKHFKVTKATKVCSKHFSEEDYVPKVANGRRHLYTHAVPSVFQFKTLKRPRKPPCRRAAQKQPSPVTPIMEIDLDETESMPNMPEATGLRMDAAHVCFCGLQAEVDELKDKLSARDKEVTKLQKQADELRTAIREKTNEGYRLAKDLERSNTRIKELEEESAGFGVQKIKSPEDIQFYTGLPSYEHFVALHDYLDPGENGKNIVFFQDNEANSAAKPGRPRKLTTENQLLLVLMKLKVGFFHRHLAHLLNISESTVSRIFTTWINLLYLELARLPLWLPRTVIDKAMPRAFKEKYPTTRVIIDATEVKCEVASSFVTQSGTYSTYKSANTFKGLVGIAPDGVLTFASELFMGSTSDRECVIKSGFLELPFDTGDSVMADKGFKIADLLERKNVALNIPPFLTKEQFSQAEVKETQDIASLRIHVERRIQRIKTYHIFDRCIPISLAPLANQIWTSVAILSNLQTVIIKGLEE